MLFFDTPNNGSGTTTLSEAYQSMDNGQGAMMDNEETKFHSLFEQVCLMDELSRCTKEDVDYLIQTNYLQELEEAGKMPKRTIVRLSKQDDLDRRITMACIERARQAGDKLWSLLRLNRIKERQLLGQIRKKYEHLAVKDARSAQKSYIKNVLPTRRQAQSLNSIPNATGR